MNETEYRCETIDHNCTVPFRLELLRNTHMSTHTAEIQYRVKERKNEKTNGELFERLTLTTPSLKQLSVCVPRANKYTQRT